jgi:uncharacterized protein (DUF2147 family)
MTRALLLVLAGLWSAAAPAASPMDGLWLTDDHKGVVRIGPCGQRICGWIVRVLDRGPGVPTHDINNPDRSLRRRAILGLPVLSGFLPYRGSWIGGTAYDPKSGRSYRASLRLGAGGALEVTGCVLLFCRTKTWTRTR